MSAFIVLEGPDGAGTTTHARLLADTLTLAGYDVLLTAEPSDGFIGTFIRSQLSQKTVPSPAALQLLFLADRAWHVDAVVRPALDSGKVVICDRYCTSTIVYGAALGLDSDWLRNICCQFPRPDLEIWTLPPLTTCIERMKKRNTTDVLEESAIVSRVYQEYASRSMNGDYPLIDTSRNTSVAAEEIAALARRALGSL